ncbi:glycoside hydrolase family 32 protein [Actinomadura barringtoniae]|uniref:Glycoside hydrolase family 32 protein n=1 Tax=Actinomadura barringtoniae TaxID=1427535 RepID=A0A939T1M5_9ACTN|nr:glycoside hydrolase family 32 protein [Actinomadura barringtoniae]MBO2447891.1 glycoside hydrolase family 32 protein [Actinomadura barringtoniae]
MVDVSANPNPFSSAPLSRRTVLGGAAAVFAAAMLRPGRAFADGYPNYPYPTTLVGAYDENYRGQFHFSSRTGWMNDPNAPLYYNGVYHLFYQHNPYGLAWDTMNWGHATSPDLVHWTQRALALEPGTHPGNLFSGAGVVDHDNVSGLKNGSDAPILVYTGTGGVLLDYSTDGAKTFTPYQNGKVVARPPAASTDSRDPKVFWDGYHRTWVMVFWSNEGGNGYDIYTSANLLDWTFASRYAADWLFECPDMYPMKVDGGTTVKWVINAASTKYVVGDFDGTRFTTAWTEPVQMDSGRNAYAGLTFNDMPDGRRVQIAWQNGNFGSVWTGNATFPAELNLVTLPEGLRVTRTPIKELQSLRSGTRGWSDRTITADPASNPLAGISADQYEVIAEFDAANATASRFGLRLHTYADGTCNSEVAYDRAGRTLMGSPLSPTGGRIKIRVLVDRGQLAVFGNAGQFSSSNNIDFDPSPAGRGIAVFAEGGTVRLVSLTFHRLARAWGDFVPTRNPGSNVPGPWQARGGTWSAITDGNTAQAPGDGFYLSGQSVSDLSYSADLRLDTAEAAGLTFRANADATQHYTANINTSGGGQIKLWRPGRDIATYNTPITRDQTYRLKVNATGPRIQVFLGTSGTPVIDVTDTTYAGGLLGLNVFNGEATLRNANAGLATDITGTWTAITSVWTDTPLGRRGWANGDGFDLSGQAASDLSYEGDLTLGSANAVGLTFRAKADASQHYTANINADGGGQLKLWRPGRDLGTYSTPIRAGQAYHLKIVTTGPRIQVFFAGGATPAIDVNDATSESGLTGLNVYAGAGTAQNLRLTLPAST